MGRQGFEHLVLGGVLFAGAVLMLGGVAHEWRKANREWRDRWRR